MMKTLAIASTLSLPMSAMAHGDAVPHIHPHGFDLTTALVLAVIAVGGLIAWQRFHR